MIKNIKAVKIKFILLSYYKITCGWTSNLLNTNYLTSMMKTSQTSNLDWRVWKFLPVTER